MTRDQQVKLWDAVNEYAASCGGDTSNATISPQRMKAVTVVEMAILKIEAESNAYLEAGMRGKDGIYPDWVYEARAAILHRDHNIPWLNDLLAALEWQGGTIHDALNCVRRLVEAEKKHETPEVTEKDRRVYYQDIVYAVCNYLDRIFARRITRGEGTVCGTVEMPSNQVQERMAEVEQRCLEWSAMRSVFERPKSPVDKEGEQRAVQGEVSSQ